MLINRYLYSFKGYVLFLKSKIVIKYNVETLIISFRRILLFYPQRAIIAYTHGLSNSCKTAAFQEPCLFGWHVLSSDSKPSILTALLTQKCWLCELGIILLLCCTWGTWKPARLDDLFKPVLTFALIKQLGKCISKSLAFLKTSTWIKWVHVKVYFPTE